MEEGFIESIGCPLHMALKAEDLMFGRDIYENTGECRQHRHFEIVGMLKIFP